MHKDFTREQIQKALETAWAVTPVPCPLVWQNQPLDQKEPKGPFCRASIRFGTTEPAAVGREFTRTTVTLTLRVFVPTDKGTAPATKAADRCDAAFLFKTISTTTSDGADYGLTGDEGCTGPLPDGTEGQNAVFVLTQRLRYDVGKNAPQN